VKFTATPLGNPARASSAAAAQYRKDLRAAAIVATDRATREAQIGTRERISGAGLGRLGNAVGYTSSKRQAGKANSRSDPYGVLYAKGGDKSLAGGALESYSRGSTIRPSAGGQWLAFPTKAIPRLISIGGRRQRITPELYMRSGLMQSIGRLIFRPLSDSKAIWVVQKVTLSPKSGQAKAAGTRKTRSRVPAKEVIAFVGVRVTRRAQRFNKDATIAPYARRVPTYIAEEIAQIQRSRGA
jgi:hypothetical protein